MIRIIVRFDNIFRLEEHLTYLFFHFGRGWHEIMLTRSYRLGIQFSFLTLIFPDAIYLLPQWQPAVACTYSDLFR